MSGRKGSSGFGGGSGNGPDDETRDIIINNLKRRIAEDDKKLNRMPTMKQIEKQMDRMIKEGTLHERTKEDYLRFVQQIGYSSTFGEDFEKFARGYIWDTKQGDQNLGLKTHWDLHEVHVKEKDFDKRQKIIRDVGAFISGLGQYNESVLFDKDLAQQSLNKHLAEMSKRKRRK